jgi:hypothetical protein
MAFSIEAFASAMILFKSSIAKNCGNDQVDWGANFTRFIRTMKKTAQNVEFLQNIS